MQHSDMNDDDELFDDESLDDFEDFDELDELEDGDWDDLEIDDLEESEENPSQVSGGQQKSFVQKYFILIVALIVITAGGLFALGQMGGKTQEPLPAPQPYEAAELPTDDTHTPAQEAADIPELDTNIMPPMPAPLDAVTTAPHDLQAIENASGVLTPMPEITAQPQDMDDLQPLEPNLDTPEDIMPVEAAVADIKQNAALVQDETAEQAEPVSEVNNSEPALQIQAFPENSAIPQDIQQEAGINIVSEAPEPPEQSNVVKLALYEEMQALKDAEITTLKHNLDEVNYALQDLQAQIKTKEAAREEALAQAELSNLELSQQVRALQSQLLAIQQQNSAASAQIQQNAEPLSAAPATEPSTSTTASPATPVKKPSLSQPKPAPAPKVISAPAPRWTLQSAQPGKAVIANRKTGDLLSIETGSNVRGLGKILSVSIENGLWVVRGTQGRVSQ